MFLKISKKYLAASVMTCCSAVLFAQSDIKSGALRDISIQEVIVDNRFEQAEKFAKLAGQDYTEANYASAIENYMQAWKLYEAIGSTDFLNSKVSNCRAQIINCYSNMANELAVKAEASSQAMDYDLAIKYAEEAIETDPSVKDKMEIVIERYKSEQKAINYRNQVSEELLVPDYKQIDIDIERLLAQAKSLYRNNRIAEAKVKYNEVITLDQTNVTALRGVTACNIALAKAGDDRARTSTMRMTAEAMYAGSLPIRKNSESYAKSYSNGTPVKKKVAPHEDLKTRLANIELNELTFDGETLPEVIQILIDEARNNDPSGEGVNILLVWPVAKVETTTTTTNSRNSRSNNNANTAVMDPMMMAMMAGGGPMPMTNTPTAATGNTGAFGMNNTGVDAETGEIIYPAVRGEFHADTLENIISSICSTLDVKYRVDGNAVIIARNDVAIGDVEIKLIPVMREALLGVDFNDPALLKAFFQSYGIKFDHADASIVYDWRSSRLIVNNEVEQNEALEELILKRFTVKDVQVQIQAKFVEVTQTDLNELGFDYTISNSSDADSGLEFASNDSTMRHLSNGSDQLVTYNNSANGFNFSGSIYALDWSDSSDVLFSPRVTTLNGETAIIRMIREVYFPDEWSETSTTTTTSSLGGYPMYSYVGSVPSFDSDPTEIGIQMLVKPEVDIARRTITMRMSPSVRQFMGWTEYIYENDGETETIREPIFANRVIDTLVTARDGETIVLGGIVSDSITTINDKIPILGDIPVIGRLFQSESEESIKKNLLIFLTCTLVNPDGSPYFADSISSQGRNGIPKITEAM